MKEFQLTANIRHELGTGASRRMRRANQIPAILYGTKKESIPLFLDAHEFNKQLEDQAFGSSIITLNLENAKEPVILKALQRHPVRSRHILHIDFMRVSASEQLQIRVPIHFINEEKCMGKKAGGIVNRLLQELEIACLPKDLPEAITIDMSSMQLGQTLHLSDLTVPEGITLTALTHGQDQTVITISSPRDSAEGGEGQEGAENPDQGSETRASG
uniref:Large ribosomal subunit protein bL25 n=1 Tax=Candidatus Kentrum sp. MB TaxID=2138164 RepID=A0A450XWD2_9GAMM|nr:MAG: LSU ribosomal protein L25P [Candidatus Kentron sp. MB]VFK76282.1 MAG: LSU ribosomal protein L25P [Candidatus Kentron sp. MB]